MIFKNNIFYNVDALMDSVREYRTGEPVSLMTRNGRPVVSAGNAEIDLGDLIEWLRQNRPELL